MTQVEEGQLNAAPLGQYDVVRDGVLVEKVGDFYDVMTDTWDKGIALKLTAHILPPGELPMTGQSSRRGDGTRQIIMWDRKVA